MSWGVKFFKSRVRKPQLKVTDTNVQTQKAAPEPEFSDLVLGIDFGTTFTGVAYARGGSINLTDVSLDRSKITDKVSIIRSWPSSSIHYAEKTPTILSYNTSPPTWGGKVKPNDQPQVSLFKLGLQENLDQHYVEQHLVSSYAAREEYLNNQYWNHPQLSQKRAVDYVADYLTCICQYVLREKLPRQYGPQFLQNQQISYVITVPAIWSDKAKQLTREAAMRAGIPREKLTLIMEPEAAALYCATLCDEVDLCVGDRFLVCDAGGGTVVRLSFVESDQIGPYIICSCQSSPILH